MSTADQPNILLVDDQPAKLLAYEAMLGELSATLLTAHSAREALDHLLRSEIAVVLVDVCMPEFDGFELAGMMREHPRFQRTPIIFVSGVHLSDLDRLRGYAAGAVDYILVPVVPEILRAKVGVFLDLYRKTVEMNRLNRELEQRVAERTAELEAVAAGLRDREQQLREADRMKDEFLATLAHEIRNPLAPILSAVQLMRLKELAEEHRNQARDIIERQVEHLVRLVDDLMDISRITRGVIELQHDRVDVAEVIARAVETSRPLIDTRRHELRVVLPPQSLIVEGDSTRLSQVVANLLNNAAKYTSKGGHIYVTVSSERHEVVIRIKDDGMGIAPDMLPHVFDLFTQADRRGSGGLGIGLALVKRLVQMHGGSVDVLSDGLGHGAELTVRLPLVAERRVEMRPSDDGQVDFKTTEPRRVLVVDDNREAADSIAWLVSIAGHEVRTAYDGQEGLTVASTFIPDVLLLDLGMPGLTGYELAKKIRHEPWGQVATLIAVTGWGQERDRRRVNDAGFDAHLVKPVDTKALLTALESRRPRSATT